MRCRASVTATRSSQPCRLYRRLICMAGISVMVSSGGCTKSREPKPEVDWTRRARGSRQSAAAESNATTKPPLDSPRSRESAVEIPIDDPSSRTPLQVPDSAPTAEPNPAAPAESASRPNGSDARGTARDGSNAAGSEARAPVLPGRQQRHPGMSAAEAAVAAGRALDRARAAARAGNTSQAVDAAFDAFHAAFPHAASDKACADACRDAEQILDSAGHGQSPAQAVPTRFE